MAIRFEWGDAGRILPLTSIEGCTHPPEMPCVYPGQILPLIHPHTYEDKWWSSYTLSWRSRLSSAHLLSNLWPWDSHWNYEAENIYMQCLLWSPPITSPYPFCDPFFTLQHPSHDVYFPNTEDQANQHIACNLSTALMLMITQIFYLWVWWDEEHKWVRQGNRDEISNEWAQAEDDTSPFTEFNGFTVLCFDLVYIYLS